MADDPSRSPAPVPEEPATPRQRRTVGNAVTANSPNRKHEPEGANAEAPDDSETLTVVIQPRDFRLPIVLSHIRAGKIVLVRPERNDPD